MRIESETVNQEKAVAPPREMMEFFPAVKTCFNKYADFQGRASRAEFWWFALFVTLVSIGAAIIDGALLGTHYDETGVIGWLWTLVTLLPSLAVGARRLHDINNSGWWQLLTLTIVGIIPLVVLWCLKSKPEANRFDKLI